LTQGVDLNKKQDSVHYVRMFSNLEIQECHRNWFMSTADHPVTLLSSSALPSTRTFSSDAKDYSRSCVSMPYPFTYFDWSRKSILQNFLHSISL